MAIVTIPDARQAGSIDRDAVYRLALPDGRVGIATGRRADAGCRRLDPTGRGLGGAASRRSAGAYGAYGRGADPVRARRAAAGLVWVRARR